MIFSAVIVGDDIKAQLRPFSVYENIEWHDVTQKAIENWKKTRIATFEEFLQGFHTEWEELPPTHWQGVPLKGQVGYIRKNGDTRVMYFGNINGRWSFHERPGDKYKDFFLLEDGSRNWQAEAVHVDLENDIRETIMAFRERWHYVREKIRTNPDIHPASDIMRSAAARLDLDAYVERHTCQYVAPDSLVMDGAWINFRDNPSWEALEKYRSIILNLAEKSPHTMLACIGLYT